MTKGEQQKRVSERDHIVIHRVTDNVIARHNNGTEVYAVEIVRKPLVRCKECKWAKANGTYQWCGRLDSTARITADGFCSYGEREGE